MALIAPRKKMAMGLLPAKGKRVNPDLNIGKLIDKSMPNLKRRSKRVSTSTRRTMVTSHAKARGMGMQHITMVAPAGKTEFMKFVVTS